MDTKAKFEKGQKVSWTLGSLVTTGTVDAFHSGDKNIYSILDYNGNLRFVYEDELKAEDA
jgi:hypothetical protein